MSGVSRYMEVRQWTSASASPSGMFNSVSIECCRAKPSNSAVTPGSLVSAMVLKYARRTIRTRFSFGTYILMSLMSVSMPTKFPNCERGSSFFFAVVCAQYSI